MFYLLAYRVYSSPFPLSVQTKLGEIYQQVYFCECGRLRQASSGWYMRLVHLAYQPPASSTFFSEQISHQQSANSTFLSQQISTSHRPPAKRIGR
jgi:hypothetical protein